MTGWMGGWGWWWHGKWEGGERWIGGKRVAIVNYKVNKINLNKTKANEANWFH